MLDLTSEGRKLVQYARRMLQLNDEAYASMSDDVLAGFVRLGVPLDFFGRDFTTWLARFKNKHPMVGLEVEANQSENLTEAQRARRIRSCVLQAGDRCKARHRRLREQLVWVSGPNYSPDAGDSVPLILFPEGCAYRRCAIAALKDHRRSWHLSFVSPSFECLKSAAVEGMGITVLARALVAPPLRVVRHGMRLPQLPTVELVYSYGRRSNSRVVSELANYLADSLTNAGTMRATSMIS